jgi:hypothetical protein
MKKSTIVLIVFFCSLIALSVIREKFHPSAKSKALSRNKYKKEIPKEYLDLFSTETQKRFDTTGIRSIVMPSGSIVSSAIYIYLDKSGNASGGVIEIFKDDLKEDRPLDQIINIDNDAVPDISDEDVTSLSEGGFDLKYKDRKKDTVSNVTWKFKGKAVRLNLKQDNLLYYNVDFKNFQIIYDNESIIWAKKTSLFFIHEKGEVIFLKKDNKLYTIFIPDAGFSLSTQPNTLSLLNHNLITQNGNHNYEKSK